MRLDPIAAMNVMIVEDEALAVERLTSLLKDYDPSIQVASTTDSVSDTVKLLASEKNIDLVFLDIQLADGKSFEVFEKVTSDLPVIFTTAYDEFALKAFKTHTIDYLLKPLQPEELAAALDKFKRLRKNVSRQFRQSIHELLQQARDPYKHRLVLKSGNKLQFKSTDEVAYFFAEGKEAYLVTKKENRKHLIGYTLEELEDFLNPKNFFRISRKFIVPADAIAEVKGLVSTKLEVRLHQPSEHQLIVSRERCQEFKQWLDQ